MKVYIFYGTGCDENSAWLPYIKNQLNSRNISCIIPNFPTPKNQTYNSWCKVLDSYSIEPNDIVIGWSTGAIFAVRYLQEHKLAVNKLLLVSGFNNYAGGYSDVDKINKDFFMPTEKAAKNIAKQITCITSDNDPFITTTALNSFAHNLGAKTLNIAGGGHFNNAAGYTTFVQLLNLILE